MDSERCAVCGRFVDHGIAAGFIPYASPGARGEDGPPDPEYLCPEHEHTNADRVAWQKWAAQVVAQPQPEKPTP